MTTAPLLAVHDLTISFGSRTVVSGVSFELAPGQRLGLIGESGSGKSLTALSVLGLLPESARATGSIVFRGEELLGRSDAELARLRGEQLAMVFQEPMTALDPTMKVGRQVAEVVRLHARPAGRWPGTRVARQRPGGEGPAGEPVAGQGPAGERVAGQEPADDRVAHEVREWAPGGDQAPGQARSGAVGTGSTRARVLQVLTAVDLPDPARIADSYPHQLSGGQRQRVVLAMALVNSPGLLLCDEPTTALDVTVQARVLTVLDEALRRSRAACLFISHDLAVVAQVCSDVLVMFDGRVVDSGPMRQVLGRPRHPYTAGLVATARLDRIEPGARLPTLADFYPAAGGAP